MWKQHNYDIITNSLMPQITYDEFVHLRKWIDDKGIGVILAIEICFDEVQYTVVSEGTPFDIDNDLEW